MAGNLWKMTAIKNAGKLTKGMSVEILVTGTSGTISMTSFSQAIGSQGRRFLIALGVLCGVGFCHATGAEASCGDYVRLRGGHVRGEEAAHRVEPSHRRVSDHQSPQRGCQGPFCSQQSEPLEVPVAPVERPSDDWALHQPVATDRPSSAGEAVPDAPESACAGVRLSILRPPR